MSADDLDDIDDGQDRDSLIYSQPSTIEFYQQAELDEQLDGHGERSEHVARDRTRDWVASSGGVAAVPDEADLERKRGKAKEMVQAAMDGDEDKMFKLLDDPDIVVERTRGPFARNGAHLSRILPT